MKELFKYEIGNVGTEAKAIKIKNAVHGKTFYNFRVEYSSYMGNWPVFVYSDDDDKHDEILGMLVFLLATSL